MNSQALKRLIPICSTLAVLLTACSSPPRQAVLQPVGPAPQANAHPENTGYLVVYSAWSRFVDQGSTGHHSRYTLTADDGSPPKVIINHADRFDEGPLRLPLSPGAYHISARSAHFGRVTVPVVIQPHQTTFVYLDGSARPELQTSSQANAVKLPDGEIVGWSATVATNSK